MTWHHCVFCELPETAAPSFAPTTTTTTSVSVKDIADFNYEGEWESTKAQHQDYDSLISISHQKWSIDFLPKSITVKRDVPRCSQRAMHTRGAWWESMKEAESNNREGVLWGKEGRGGQSLAYRAGGLWPAVKMWIINNKATFLLCIFSNLQQCRI